MGQIGFTPTAPRQWLKLSPQVRERIGKKLDAFAALDRLHLDAADAELAVPAGLLLVLAFRVGFAANRLTIGHLRRLERQVHVIAFVELRHNYFDMLLAGARQEKFLGLRVAGKAQGRVLFQNFVDGHPDAIFVGARLRLDRKCDRWLGNGRGLVENRGRLVPERLARGCFLQLGHGADVARAQFGHFGKLLALHYLDVLEALRRRVVEIRQRRIVFQDAAHHLVVRDAPREGIGERLENEEGERLRVVHFALGAVALPAGLRCARRDALAGMRENIGYERQQARAADIEQRDAGGLDSLDRLREARAHHRELLQVLGPDLQVGADVDAGRACAGTARTGRRPLRWRLHPARRGLQSRCEIRLRHLQQPIRAQPPVPSGHRGRVRAAVQLHTCQEGRVLAKRARNSS